MAKGITVYLSEKEILAVIEACEEWYSIMLDGEETSGFAEDIMDHGLGSALWKLYRGRYGEKIYRKYKIKR